MELLTQGAAAVFTVGPVRATTGPTYTGMAAADFAVRVDGAAPVLLSTLSGAAVTPDASGYYDLAFTAGNLGTAGRWVVTCVKATYTMEAARFRVVPAANHAALFTAAPGTAGGLADHATLAAKIPTSLTFTGSAVQVDVRTILGALPAGYTPSQLAAANRDVDNRTPAANSLGADARAAASGGGGSDTPGTATLLSRVTGPVALASGVVLAADGMDAVVVETGINARQALAAILAPSAGVLSGAGTGTIVIKNPAGTTTRITATCDAAGNRTAVTPTLPT